MNLPSFKNQSSANHNAWIGLSSALSCFSLWGLFPIYFKLLSAVPALEVLAHRILGSAVLLVLMIVVRKQWSALRAEFSNSRRLGFYLLTALLISGNWLVYIWAVQQGRILEASLGYYINPLVNVLLGVWFLGERLNQRQLLAVLIAGCGVLILLIGHGVVPWVSLVLGVSFGGYGLLRKKAGHPPMLGLCVETVLIAPLALLFLLVEGGGVLGTLHLSTDLLLLAAGPVTVFPLLLFLDATQRLRLSTVGVIQYLTPTLQFLLAVVVYHEPLSVIYLAAFACIWLALALYSTDAWLHQYRLLGVRGNG